jgi:phosphohistidine phosphatase SixA
VTTLLLVRHASAGKRSEWWGDDRDRPLDERGWRQAEGLVEMLVPRSPTRVLSSPYLRCRQTVEPLADALGLVLESRPELAEGAAATEVDGLVESLGDEEPVLCTHGDVVDAIVGEESEKGSTWVLGVEGETLVRLEYLPPRTWRY